MNNKIAHKSRLNIFSKEQEVILNENSISVISAKGQQSVLLNSIYQINLQHVPQFRYNPEQFICTMHYNEGKIRLVNQSVKTAGAFVDRSETYSDFVEKLHQKIASKKIKFVAGVSYYKVLLIVFSILLFTVLSIAIGTFIAGKYDVGVVLIVSFLALLFVLKQNQNSYKRKDYDPRNIPNELLPKIHF